jgi:mRNA-degrading endonuclease toxin of MazEF toxin-antitoxin module
LKWPNFFPALAFDCNFSLKNPSAINLDHVQTVDKNRLSDFIAHLDDTVMERVCEALAKAVHCREK